MNHKVSSLCINEWMLWQSSVVGIWRPFLLVATNSDAMQRRSHNDALPRSFFWCRDNRILNKKQKQKVCRRGILFLKSLIYCFAVRTIYCACTRPTNNQSPPKKLPGINPAWQDGFLVLHQPVPTRRPIPGISVLIVSIYLARMTVSRSTPKNHHTKNPMNYVRIYVAFVTKRKKIDTDRYQEGPSLFKPRTIV